jgi:hypothetical protein
VAHTQLGGAFCQLSGGWDGIEQAEMTVNIEMGKRL